MDLIDRMTCWVASVAFKRRRRTRQAQTRACLTSNLTPFNIWQTICTSEYRSAGECDKAVCAKCSCYHYQKRLHTPHVPAFSDFKSHDTRPWPHGRRMKEESDNPNDMQRPQPQLTIIVRERNHQILQPPLWSSRDLTQGDVVMFAPPCPNRHATIAFVIRLWPKEHAYTEAGSKTLPEKRAQKHIWTPTWCSVSRLGLCVSQCIPL